MILNPACAPTQQDTWRQRAQAHWDDRHDYSAYLGTCCDCDDGEDNDVTAWLRKWQAGVAEKVAVVRGIANSSRKGKTR